MLTDISQVIDRSGATSPEPPHVPRLDFVYCESMKDADKALISYESNPEIYDSGKMLVVFYERNDREPDATENRLLNYIRERDGGYKHDIIQDALSEVFPDPALFYPTVTLITLETINGVFTSSISEAVDDIVHYLPIPPHLSHIPTVPITELRKVACIDIDVDYVKWKGQTFAFKNPTEEYRLEGSLAEVTILDRLRDSPNIIDLEAIVVNQDNEIRGFLMPFMYAGELGDVLNKVREELGVSENDDKLVLDWSIKHAWARQITQGVVDLHSIQAYNGDLKIENILFGPKGQAILIDFLSEGVTDDFAAPEVLAIWGTGSALKPLLTGPADIFSLGVILHSIAREDARGIRVLAWRDGPGSAPSWYRDVVERCLHFDPSARPTAAEVLSILQEHNFASV